MKMGLEDVVLVFLILVLVCMVGCVVVDLARNSYSDTLCKANGYDYGTNLFWQNLAVCTDVIQKEELELTCIPSPCK
jgi:hypothetical protein